MTKVLLAHVAGSTSTPTTTSVTASTPATILIVITRFRYFTIVLFFTLHFFSFSQGMQTRERAHFARSVFPFIKKKKLFSCIAFIVVNSCLFYIVFI